MSSLMPNATDGLFAAFLTGVFGLLTIWRQRRSEKPARKDAWQKQAEVLRNELRAANAERISYLEGQLAARDDEIGRKDAEIVRLNKLVNRRGG